VLQLAFLDAVYLGPQKYSIVLALETILKLFVECSNALVWACTIKLYAPVNISATFQASSFITYNRFPSSLIFVSTARAYQCGATYVTPV
jgi:hypothetical protein